MKLKECICASTVWRSSSAVIDLTKGDETATTEISCLSAKCKTGEKKETGKEGKA
jgi:hypothetical protein